MKQIVKSKQPNSLGKYKKNIGAEYDGADFSPVKKDIKNSLLKEQGYLCAYCMQRICFDEMKVEHFFSQSKYKDKQLDYKNFLGCCLGGMGERAKDQTCDTKKGNEDIAYSPSNNRHRIDNKIHYTHDGYIKSNDSKFNEDINTRLNLNNSRFILNRILILEALECELNSRKGERNREQVEKMIEKYSSVDKNGKYKEYYGVILFFLNKKYTKCTS